MRLLLRPALLSAMVMALMGFGLNRLLQGLVVPRILERGNVLMVRAVVPPLDH